MYNLLKLHATTQPDHSPPLPVAQGRQPKSPEPVEMQYFQTNPTRQSGAPEAPAAADRRLNHLKQEYQTNLEIECSQPAQVDQAEFRRPSRPQPRPKQSSGRYHWSAWTETAKPFCFGGV